ncbi:hypothetical protein EDB87DRAFT_1580390 [Lactarius vividus]|nr:hypothetical protein EDB87DRAFT_1580390 [Lactarius vividus]
MLTLLRELEESALNLIKQYIRRGSQSRLASPTEQPDMTTGGPLSASAMRVSAQRESILVLDQREDEFNFYEESGRVLREQWDKPLVVTLRRMGCGRPRVSGRSRASSTPSTKCCFAGAKAAPGGGYKNRNAQLGKRASRAP